MTTPSLREPPLPIVGEKRRGSEEEDGDGVGMKGIIKQKEMAEDKGSKERKKGSDHRERERERELDCSE